MGTPICLYGLCQFGLNFLGVLRVQGSRKGRGRQQCFGVDPAIQRLKRRHGSQRNSLMTEVDRLIVPVPGWRNLHLGQAQTGFDETL
jgi:hypothetical protein